MEFSKKQTARFWSKVNKTDTCWLWTGICYSAGYGRFSFKDTCALSHRVSWLINGNTIPDNHLIRHKCRNKNCVNPDHLETGTHAENSADMIRDGNSRRGTKSNTNKLTEEQVKIIYNSIKSQNELAIEYNVKPTTINAIKTRRNWGWLTNSNDT